MDPKFLEELQKLKEQKSADLNKIQDDLAQFNIPDFEDTEEEIPEEESSGGTIKFERVTDQTPVVRPPVPGGRRGRKPEISEEEIAAKKKRKTVRNAILISAASVVAVVLVAIAVFFGVRNANMTNYSYPYWGMGVAIENGVPEYTFFGNLKTLTQYGPIGQVEALAEFEKGNCIKETVFTPEGDVEYYYTHEYDDGYRILSTYHVDGQMVISAKYTPIADGKIQTETTFYLEENRVDTTIITLNEKGNISSEEFYNEGIKYLRKIYTGTLVLEETYYNENQEVVHRIVYEYEEKLLKTQTEYDGSGAITTRTVHQYNDKNLLTKTICYDGQGVILNYDTFNYDLNDNPIKQVSYAGDGTMQQQILRVFNDKNRITKETALQADGIIIYCSGYDYDEKGYISKSIVYDKNNSTVISEYTLYTRNDAGSVMEMHTYNSGNILTVKILYNNAGFITNHCKYSDTGVLLTEEKYKYDEKQRQTETDVVTYSEVGEKLSHYNELYNTKGLVTVRVDEIFAQNFYEQKLFQYHKDGWKLSEAAYDASGKKLYDRTFNEKQQIVDETLCENGQDILFFEYTYNEKNQVSFQKTFDMQTNILTKTIYTYSEDGSLLSAVHTDNQDRLLHKQQYNAFGLVILQTNYGEGGVADSYYRFDYDEENRLIVQEFLDEKQKVLQKTVYYYWDDGSHYYIVFDENGIPLEDSRGPEFLEDEKPNPEDDPENTDTENSDQTDTSDTTDTWDSGSTGGSTNTTDTTDTTDSGTN